MAASRDALIRTGYRLGWRLAGRLPAPVATRTIALAARRARRDDGLHVRTLRRNLTLAAGHPVGDALLEAALRSYLRNLYEMLALPSWPARRIVGSVSVIGERALRAAVAESGAVVALPHSGNWDLAGAWACLTRLPVTTVAEELGGGDFQRFVAFREGLGMEVLSHRDPAAIARLVHAVRSGRVVCLLADRDLAGTGLPVRWRDQPVTMPAGPAVVARRSGAALFPGVCHYTPSGMTITLGTPVRHRPGRDGLIAMTQDVADFFAARIALRPEDWHLMQPFFPAEESA